MQFIIKKFLIILTFVIFISTPSKLYTASFDDFGIISIMYHRFNESKYPSTNIQLEVFKEQLQIIENEGIKFINPKDFKTTLLTIKKKEKSIVNYRRWFVVFIKMRGLY